MHVMPFDQSGSHSRFECNSKFIIVEYFDIMEYLSNDPLLKYHPDTLQCVRKLCNLDNPGDMDGAIDVLESWVQKQQQFTKKNFSREYLERTIIRANGSVELAKEHLDKLCLSRTLLPNLFFNCDVGTPLLEDGDDAILPTQTKDYFRVYIGQNKIKHMKSEMYDAYYKRFFHILEYLCAHDYSCGLILIYDFRYTNHSEFAKLMEKTVYADFYNIILNGYGFNIKGMYIIATSNLVNSFVSLVKEAVSKEVGEKIHVLKNVEELYSYVDKDILPEEYGGQEASISELHQKYVNVMSSEGYRKYIATMSQAKTIENEGYF